MKKIGLALMFMSQISSAATWYTVNSFDGKTYQVDLDSIADVSGYKKIWTRELLEKPQQVPSNTFVWYIKLIGLWYYDCKRKMNSVPASYYYDKSGAIVSSSVYQFSSAQMSDIIPESLGENVEKIVCEFDVKRIGAMKKDARQNSRPLQGAIDILSGKPKSSNDIPGLPPAADMLKDWDDLPAAPKK